MHTDIEAIGAKTANLGNLAAAPANVKQYLERIFIEIFGNRVSMSKIIVVSIQGRG